MHAFRSKSRSELFPNEWESWIKRWMCKISYWKLNHTFFPSLSFRSYPQTESGLTCVQSSAHKSENELVELYLYVLKKIRPKISHVCLVYENLKSVYTHTTPNWNLIEQVRSTVYENPSRRSIDIAVVVCTADLISLFWLNIWFAGPNLWLFLTTVTQILIKCMVFERIATLFSLLFFWEYAFAWRLAAKEITI